MFSEGCGKLQLWASQVGRGIFVDGMLRTSRETGVKRPPQVNAKATKRSQNMVISRRAQAGDAQAFRQLVANYRARIFTRAKGVARLAISGNRRKPKRSGNVSALLSARTSSITFRSANPAFGRGERDPSGLDAQFQTEQRRVERARVLLLAASGLNGKEPGAGSHLRPARGEKFKVSSTMTISCLILVQTRRIALTARQP